MRPARGGRRAVIHDVDVVNLQLVDRWGTLHTVVSERGISGFLGPQGISYALSAGAGGPGLVMWMKDGTPRRVGRSPQGLALFDGTNSRRLAVGELGDPAERATGAGEYGIEVRAADGARLLQLP